MKKIYDLNLCQHYITGTNGDEAVLLLEETNKKSKIARFHPETLEPKIVYVEKHKIEQDLTLQYVSDLIEMQKDATKQNIQEKIKELSEEHELVKRFIATAKNPALKKRYSVHLRRLETRLRDYHNGK